MDCEILLNKKCLSSAFVNNNYLNIVFKDIMNLDRSIDIVASGIIKLGEYISGKSNFPLFDEIFTD